MIDITGTNQIDITWTNQNGVYRFQSNTLTKIQFSWKLLDTVSTVHIRQSYYLQI